jgi:hypothetical protein
LAYAAWPLSVSPPLVLVTASRLNEAGYWQSDDHTRSEPYLATFLYPNYSRNNRQTITKLWPQFKRDLALISSTTSGLHLTGSPCDAGAFRPRCHFPQKRQMLIGSRQDVFRHATDACPCSRRLVPSVWAQLACSESMILASSSAPSSNLAKRVARCGRISSGGGAKTMRPREQMRASALAADITGYTWYTPRRRRYNVCGGALRIPKHSKMLLWAICRHAQCCGTDVWHALGSQIVWPVGTMSAAGTIRGKSR